MNYQTSNIRVAVRVRPLLPHESTHTSQRTRVDSDSIVQLLNSLSAPDSHDLKRFKFDKVFADSSQQSEIFSDCSVDCLANKVVEGYNATIFAYGQTGSGKTYTMQGYEYRHKQPIIRADESVGLIPRSISSLFSKIAESPPDTEFTVFCSYIQLYNERVYDLLNPAGLRQNGLKLRWNKQQEFYVQNLFLHPCFSAEEVLSHFHAGLRNKVMASHNLNSASSRSHCILSLQVEALNTSSGTVTRSKLNLVDLAGSERVAFTGNEGIRLKESVDINRALFTLRQVITSLSARDGSHVPYRDSKLTSLLKQGIGGNSYSLMIACLSPSDVYYEENLSTLTYATQAGRITNEPEKNTDAKSKLIEALQGDNRALRQELEAAQTQIGMLAEIIKLERADQVHRLKHMEGLPFKPVHIERIRALRSALETHRSRSQHKEVKQFTVPPEVMSDKLHESVSVIRELMDSNRQMKDTIAKLVGGKKQMENRISTLEEELLRMRERVEEAGKGEGGQLFRLQQDKQMLEERLEQIESENTLIQRGIPKQAWGRPEESALNFSMKPFLPPLGSERPPSEEVTKKEAISALSQMLRSRALTRK